MWINSAQNAAISNEPNNMIPATIAPILKVPISPGKILAGNLLYIKKGINIAITGTVKIIASAEFQIIPHIKRKKTAIKQVPEPSPLYPSNIFTVFVKTAIIIGIRNGYIIVNLVLSKKGIVGDDILIKPTIFAKKNTLPENIESNIL